MATLNIRNLPDRVHKRLRVRAAKAGRSMEAEAREILASACGVEEPRPRTTAADLRALIDRLYADRKPTGVVEDLLRERRREAAKEASE